MTDDNAFIDNLKEKCVEKSLRLTDTRLSVAQIISESSKPIGAYDILSSLERFVDNPKPPTVYRALEFLAKHNFVHKIESLNAYVTCCIDHLHTGSQFMICDGCGTVIEAHLCSLPKGLDAAADKVDFQVLSWNVELHGLCGMCG